MTEQLTRDLGIIQLRVGELTRQFEGTIKSRAGQLDRFAIGEQRRVLGVPFKREHLDLRDVFIERNTRLIKTLANEQVQQVARLVERTQTQGARVEDIAKEIKRSFDVTSSRAQLIARDQTLKMNANLSQQMHREVGITSYIWSTSRDERVREEHEELEGQEFSYDDPPPPGNPGEDFQCRCIALPVIPDLDSFTPYQFA